MVEAMPYLPVDGRPFRMTLGLRALDLAEWLEPDEDHAAELALKDRLLRDHRDTVLVHDAAGDAGSAELLTLVQQHLRIPAEPAVGMHPIEAASRLVQEDFVVLTRLSEPLAGRDDIGWVLTAACVCFPSRWHLPDKLGRNVLRIHDPVPGYADAIGAPVDATFDRLTVGRPLWRLNWTVLDDPSLFLPAAAGRARRPLPDPASLSFRVERQTLRRLPVSDDIVFTIRTYVAPLARLVAQRPALRGHLAGTMEGIDAEFAGYKGWSGLLEPLREWLTRT